MTIPPEFYQLVLNSIPEQIVVIDETGLILFINQSWSDSGQNNKCLVNDDWNGVNYLDVCDNAANTGDKYGADAAEGIREVISKKQPFFYFEYPCHSPNQKRWFMMRVSPVQQYSDKYFVISHLDITKRKLAEEEANSLAKMDGLTGIPNRRTFDDFINNEIKRCARLKNPICLAIIDIDHFKLLNDTYGHLAGDKCLVAVSKLLEQYANRPRDIFARYGGEEFALVWGDTPLADAKMLAKKLLQDIANLNIPNPNSPITNHLTASIGIVEVWPDQNTTEDALIDKADHLLYKAKENCRNRLEC